MEPRPKIKLTLSPLDKKLQTASILLLVIMWALSVYAYLRSPEIIPTHFDSTGRADDFGSKNTYLILAGVATIIYFGMTQLNKIPHKFNYLVKITLDNAEQQYILATRLFRFLIVAILLIFTLIILLTFLTTTGKINGPGSWFLPLSFALFLVPIFIWMGNSAKRRHPNNS